MKNVDGSDGGRGWVVAYMFSENSDGVSQDDKCCTYAS